MFQGRRAETAEKNARLPIPADQIDALILSHAHIDHSGRLPLLAREGYTRSVFCTPATHDLCAIMLMDSAHIQEKDAEFLARHHRPFVPPLYGQVHVGQIMSQMVSVPYDRDVGVLTGVGARSGDAGPILGSAAGVLDCNEGSRQARVVFSGDIGRWGLPIIRDPQPPTGADAVIMESTYGNRDHESVADMPDRLAE